MKALMFQRPETAEVLEVERPEIAPDEILVASRAVGVCHSDFDLLSGKYIIPIEFPTIPGHEWSGEVVEVGREVTSFAPGDRVVGECVIGEDHFGFSISGAAAEYFKVRPEWLHKLPDELSFAYGALVEPFTVAYYGVQEAGNVNASDTVAVLGAGPVGLCCLAAAGGHGANVVVVDPVAERREIATAMGATAAIEPGEGLAERFAAAAGEAPQVVIEASGNPAAMASALDLAAFKARLVYVGIETGDSAPTFLGQIQSKELTIRGVIGSPNVWPAALRFLARGEIDLSPVITASFPLARATEALDAARRTGENVKVQMVSE
ncbi:MAG TPA: zinc-binding dehydrogenase [Solirubrobacterales bacterium]|nr:zinc-binding dehydrogenase [Solirubrobacterales bacterium]